MVSHEQLEQFLAQIRHPEKRTWILLVPNSLGETVVVCGLAQAFLKKHGHGITLVIPESHAFIPQCFPNTFDRVVYMDLELMRQFSTTGFIPPNFFNLDFPINTWIAQHGDGRIGSLYELWVESLGSAGLNFIDMNRYVLRLDWKAEFVAPRIPEDATRRALDIAFGLGIKLKQSVVFFVGNNTNRPAPAFFWRKLAECYQARGMDVVINKYGAMLQPEELAIPGARVIDLPLDIAVPFCESAGHVVVGANGFVVLALASRMDCEMNVLLSDEVCWDYRNFQYRKINPFNGCHQLGMPELSVGLENLREWLLRADCDNATLETIANGIAFGTPNEFLIEAAPAA
ncbi:MAG: hypothetical protein EKK46_02055 [Rhodocyclaceae bacterium]|nr:MAG: hypothetical protein EKK46_02055 [Rhodocyclaceae bacterium]